MSLLLAEIPKLLLAANSALGSGNHLPAGITHGEISLGGKGQELGSTEVSEHSQLCTGQQNQELFKTWIKGERQSS